MSDAMKSIMTGYHPSITLPQPGIDRTSAPSSDEDKEKVCKDFESFMLYSMLKYMEKTTKMSKKGYAEETYMAMMYEKVADFLAEKGVGIKEMLMRYSEREDTSKVIRAGGDNSGKR
jgi:Rod binding domain-containing protein